MDSPLFLQASLPIPEVSPCSKDHPGSKGEPTLLRTAPRRVAEHGGKVVDSRSNLQGAISDSQVRQYDVQQHYLLEEPRL